LKLIGGSTITSKVFQSGLALANAGPGYA